MTLLSDTEINSDKVATEHCVETSDVTLVKDDVPVKPVNIMTPNTVSSFQHPNITIPLHIPSNQTVTLIVPAPSHSARVQAEAVTVPTPAHDAVVHTKAAIVPRPGDKADATADKTISNGLGHIPAAQVVASIHLPAGQANNSDCVLLAHGLHPGDTMDDLTGEFGDSSQTATKGLKAIHLSQTYRILTLVTLCSLCRTRRGTSLYV